MTYPTPGLQLLAILLLKCGIAGGNMWISEQESETVASTLFPKMKKTKQEHEDLLYEAVTLEV